VKTVKFVKESPLSKWEKGKKVWPKGGRGKRRQERTEGDRGSQTIPHSGVCALPYAWPCYIIDRIGAVKNMGGGGGGTVGAPYGGPAGLARLEKYWQTRGPTKPQSRAQWGAHEVGGGLPRSRVAGKGVCVFE